MKRISDVIGGKIESPLSRGFSKLVQLSAPPIETTLARAEDDGFTLNMSSGVYYVYVTNSKYWQKIKFLLAINNTYWWKTYAGGLGKKLVKWRVVAKKQIRNERFFFRSFDDIGEKFNTDDVSEHIAEFERNVKAKLDRHEFDLIRIGTAANLGDRIKNGYLDSKGYPSTFSMFEFHEYIAMRFFPILDDQGLRGRELERKALRPIQDPLLDAYKKLFDDWPLWNQSKR